MITLCWKYADPGIAEVEDARKRLAGLKSQQYNAFNKVNKEDLEELSPETLGQLNDALHEVLRDSVITLMKDLLSPWLF